VMTPDTFPEINRFKKDWGHANALFIDKDGHYLISWRDFNEVWKINNTTGNIIWKYGVNSINDPEHKFYSQHHIQINMDGDYMLFDNGFARSRKTSRAVMFKEVDGNLHNTGIITLPDSLFSQKQGSVVQFEKDRFLFSSPMNKFLAVTNREGDILWLAKSEHGFYRAYYLDKDVLD